jgi:hypothetical protein
MTVVAERATVVATRAAMEAVVDMMAGMAAANMVAAEAKGDMVMIGATLMIQTTTADGTMTDATLATRIRTADVTMADVTLNSDDDRRRRYVR